MKYIGHEESWRPQTMDLVAGIIRYKCSAGEFCIALHRSMSWIKLIWNIGYGLGITQRVVCV